MFVHGIDHPVAKPPKQEKRTDQKEGHEEVLAILGGKQPFGRNGHGRGFVRWCGRALHSRHVEATSAALQYSVPKAVRQHTEVNARLQSRVVDSTLTGTMREIMGKTAFSPTVKGFAFNQTRSFLGVAFRVAAPLCAFPFILSLSGCISASSGSQGKPGKQQSLSEWRRLTEKSAATPKVFV